MEKKQKSGLAVLIIIAVVAIAFAAMNVITIVKGPVASGIKKSPSNISVSFKTNKNYIAALYIEGVIQSENQTYNQDWLLNTIHKLKNDKNNKGLAIFIDSPGGTVYEADETYLALQNYKTSGKPVYVYQGHLAASGGYYISCAAKKIYANRNTLTGSIGVITGSSFDLTGLFENLGIKSETIHAGKNKNMFNMNEPVSAEQRAIMQSIADECYEQFTSIVAMSRNIPINDVKKLADGRIYTANQALKNGLIDSVGTWENMIADMKDNEFDGAKYDVVDFKYNREKTLRDFVMGASKNESPVAEAVETLLAESKLQYPAYLYR